MELIVVLLSGLLFGVFMGRLLCTIASDAPAQGHTTKRWSDPNTPPSLLRLAIMPIS